jgi:hypothetical protein
MCCFLSSHIDGCGLSTIPPALSQTFPQLTVLNASWNSIRDANGTLEEEFLPTLQLLYVLTALTRMIALPNSQKPCAFFLRDTGI